MPAESSPLKQRITGDMKSAMRAGEKEKLVTIRLILSAIKQIEVDTRKDLNDTQVLSILDKMVKQRRESISHFEKAGRNELAAKEHQEIAIIQDYLPTQLSETEINAIIEEAISTTAAVGLRDMGKVMGILKPKLQGRADMGSVSASIKARLSN